MIAFGMELLGTLLILHHSIKYEIITGILYVIALIIYDDNYHDPIPSLVTGNP